MLQRFTLLCSFLILLCTCVRAQNTVSNSTPEVIYGVITDYDNNPLLGATLHAVGTTSGTCTLLDGYYELVLPKYATSVEIRYLGYNTRRIAIADITTEELSVKLHDTSINLDQVVVTAQRVGRRTGCGWTCIWEADTTQLYININTGLGKSAIYPNPFVQDVNLRTELEVESPLNIQLINTLGQTIHYWPEQKVFAGEQHHALNMPANLLPGTYFLRLKDSSGREITKTIVKAGTISSN